MQSEIPDFKKLILMQGISGSGKSTWAAEQAKNPDIEVVSRDAIRRELLGSALAERYFTSGMDFSIEQVITTRENMEIARHLKAGKTVIVDNTNLKLQYVAKYVRVGLDCGLVARQMMIKRIESPSVDVSFDRVKNRRYTLVPKEIIEKQQASLSGITWGIEECVEKAEELPSQTWFFPSFPVEEYKADKNYPRAIIFDIDGTLAHRNILDGTEIRYRSFYEYDKCNTDLSDPLVKSVVTGAIKSNIVPIFLTGRKNDCEAETREFLDGIVDGADYVLLMRDPTIDSHDGKDDKDDKVKYRIFNESIRNKYNVLGVFEDRRRVVALWEAVGLRVANMGSLNEEY